MQTVPCPNCGSLAYISMYEPTLAHCANDACSWFFVLDEGVWTPYRQGMTEEKYRAWKAQQAASTPVDQADDTKQEGP
jgi:hypothetical protein